jgi:hypothetical protein
MTVIEMIQAETIAGPVARERGRLGRGRASPSAAVYITRNAHALRVAKPPRSRAPR